MPKTTSVPRVVAGTRALPRRACGPSSRRYINPPAQHPTEAQVTWEPNFDHATFVNHQKRTLPHERSLPGSRTPAAPLRPFSASSRGTCGRIRAPRRLQQRQKTISSKVDTTLSTQPFTEQTRVCSPPARLLSQKESRGALFLQPFRQRGAPPPGVPSARREAPPRGRRPPRPRRKAKNPGESRKNEQCSTIPNYIKLLSTYIFQRISRIAVGGEVGPIGPKGMSQGYS